MAVLGICARAERSPDAIAVRCEASDSERSYSELIERAAKLAGVLADFGIGIGDRVALTCEARTEVFEAQLACARVGAALVPINWRLSAAEQLVVLDVAKPKLVIESPDLSKVPHGLPTVTLGSDYEQRLAPASPLPPRLPQPEELGQILFTSGTTGTPKGAMIPWSQIEFNAAQTIELCDLDTSSSTLAFLPTFHTGGLNCLALPTLAAGGCVWLMERFNPRLAACLLGSGTVEATVAVPQMYRSLLDAGFVGTTSAKHNYLVGGAPLSSELAHAYDAIGCRLRQGFGMTEVGPNCFTGGFESIGQPTPGTQARVVDAEGNEVAVGDVGELELNGPHVCTGYFENRRASMISMRGKWFRTGDLASCDERGNYAIAGRKKDMFISGGENVYPAEVESALSRHPGVSEVAVVGVPDSKWGEVGMAVVVLSDGADQDPDAIRAFARQWLAGYKVLCHVTFAEALPRTATGKIAKPALIDQVATTLTPKQEITPGRLPR